VVRRINALPIPTASHLHGGHVPTASDGFPTDLVYPPGYRAMPDMPGMTNDPRASTTTGFRDYTYPMNQRAATLWYHDHRMGFTGPDV
jgi:spore coat protein A